MRLTPRREGPWYANALIFGRKEEMLVDSGASGAFLNLSEYKAMCQNNDIILESVQDEFEMADGTPLFTFGQFKAPISLGPFQTEHVFIIADLGNIPGIIGLDFLEDHDILTRWKYGQMIIGADENIVVQMKRGLSEKCCKITHSRNIIIPPQTEQFVEIKVNQSHQLLEEGIIEPTASLVRSGLLMARSLVKVEKDKVKVRLLNVHDTPITLQRDRPIGLLHPLSKLAAIINPVDMKEEEDPEKVYSTDDLPAHLHPVLEGADLDKDQESRAVKLILKYKDVFVGPDGFRGQTSLVKHIINTASQQPIKQAPRRLPWNKQDEVNRQLDEMLEKNVAEPSDSAWASPIVLATKSDGSWRFCVDYRKLNECTIKDSYPLPRIDETLDTLSGSEWFCTSDLASGYWQGAMSEEDKHKTAFTTRRGLFQFRVMPFGLANAPATFQRLMELVLRGMQWEQVMVYIDDVIVFAPTFDEVIDRLDNVLSRL